MVREGALGFEQKAGALVNRAGLQLVFLPTTSLGPFPARVRKGSALAWARPSRSATSAYFRSASRFRVARTAVALLGREPAPGEARMKVRERIDTITDLFLGAMYADHRFEPAERAALEHMLCELLLLPELPSKLRRRIASFSPERFDLAATAREFRRDPPMRPRRLLELTAQLCVADGEFDLEEDDYLHRLGRALELAPLEYDDIVLDYELVELSSVERRSRAMRPHGRRRSSPPPVPKRSARPRSSALASTSSPS